jgi:hypothetical protein
VRIPAETLRRLAEQLNNEPRDMTAHHDPSQLIRVRDQHALVERTHEGEWLLKMRAVVHRGDWDAWQAVLKQQVHQAVCRLQ